MNIDMIVSSLINDESMQQKFNNFDNFKDVFGEYSKDEYYSCLHKYIENKIKNNIRNNNFDISYMLEFANTFIKNECINKPYLIEFDIITEVLCEQASYYDSLLYKSDGEFEEKGIYLKKVKTLEMLRMYKEYFSSKLVFNELREKELLNYYKNKLENNENLSLKETEELGYMYCIDSINEEEKEKYVNFLLKNILENNYNIKFQIYKNIFKSKCEEILKKENINLDLLFRTNRNKNTLASFNEKGNAILFNKDNVKSTEMILNFRSFFHELRHYKQINSSEVNIEQLNFAKDKLLKETLGYSYYDKNYNDISYEKDAIYSSSEEVIKFIHDLSPKSVGVAKEIVKKDIKRQIRKTNLDTTERVNPSRNNDTLVVNFNLLFESIISKKGKLLKNLLKDSKSYMVLLHEYNINGSKKDLIELLKLRDENLNNKKLYSFYNYLIYDIEVSFAYILKNACKLKVMRNTKYKEELNSIIKSRLVKYFITKKTTGINSLKRNEEYEDETKKIRKRITEEISNLRKRIIENFRKDKNIGVYLTSEEELRNGYSYLSELLNENSNKKSFVYFDIEDEKSHQL